MAGELVQGWGWAHLNESLFGSSYVGVVMAPAGAAGCCRGLVAAMMQRLNDDARRQQTVIAQDSSYPVKKRGKREKKVILWTFFTKSARHLCMIVDKPSTMGPEADKIAVAHLDNATATTKRLLEALDSWRFTTSDVSVAPGASQEASHA